jgi:hypothetical protein
MNLPGNEEHGFNCVENMDFVFWNVSVAQLMLRVAEEVCDDAVFNGERLLL